MNTIYQLKLGKPFVLKEIDLLFYACNIINSNTIFLMEKEKFFNLLHRGLITEYRKASNL